MLTNEQCIEIAEKVWGWECNIDKNDPICIHLKGPFENADPGMFETGIYVGEFVGEVNSWQGFGRTVEAMAEKDWAFQEVEFGAITQMAFVDDKASPHPITWDPFIATSLITATHLAALEALKDG